MSFHLPELPYANNTLEPYCPEITVRLHYDVHHKVHINGLNRNERKRPGGGGVVQGSLAERKNFGSELKAEDQTVLLIIRLMDQIMSKLWSSYVRK